MAHEFSINSTTGRFIISTGYKHANKFEDEHYETIIMSRDINRTGKRYPFMTIDEVDKSYSRADAISAHMETVAGLA